jgi:hypothetical protein
MARATLVLGKAALTVAMQRLGRAYGLFAAGGAPSHDRVQSRVPLGLFQLFIEMVNGNDIQITNEDVSGLSKSKELSSKNSTRVMI